MKAMILNGMHEGDSLSLDTQHALVELLEDGGWQVESIVLHQRKIRPCAGCFGCWTKEPGQCVMDDANDIMRSFMQSDLVVFLTPVTFGGYSSELKKAVDHLIGILLPFFQTVDGETHHKARYEDYPRLLAIGLLPQRNEEIERLFTSVVARNAINMFPPAWTTGFITPDHNNGYLYSQLHSMLSRVEVAQ